MAPSFGSGTGVRIPVPPDDESSDSVLPEPSPGEDGPQDGGFIKRVRRQIAVYWPNPETDGYGSYTFDPPVEVTCRWDEEIEKIIQDAGDEIISRASVLLGFDPEKGAYLYRGTIADLITIYGITDYLNPLNVVNAYPIRVVYLTPDIRNKFVLREVKL